MTREERDYQEALRRIKEAEKNKNVGLDLDGLYLSSFPPELASLTSLQSLNLALCDQLSGDLSPLASLTSLQRLDLAGCGGLTGNHGTAASKKLGVITLSRSGQ